MRISLHHSLRRAWGALAIAAAVAAGLVLAPVGGPVAQAQTTLKAQYFLPKGHPVSRHLEEEFQAIEKATGGDVQIQSFYASELVPLPQALDGLSGGTLDILVGPGNYYSGKVAIGDVSIMPLNVKDFGDRYRLFYDEGLREVLDGVYREELGVAIVAPHAYYIGEQLLVRKGVTVDSYGDIRGLKIRVAGGELIELVKAMGGQPAFVAPPEMYTALQRGTVDAAIFPLHDLQLLKLSEVVGQVVGPDYLFTGPMMHFFMWNAETWDGLSAQTRQQIDGVLRDFAKRDDVNSEQELDIAHREQAKAAGVQFSNLSQSDLAQAEEAIAAARQAYLRFNREQGHGDEAEQVLSILDRVSGLR